MYATNPTEAPCATERLYFTVMDIVEFSCALGLPLSRSSTRAASSMLNGF